MITANDPAGMAIAFTNAINRYSKNTCRLITSEERYGFAYETDIHLPDTHDDDFTEVEDLLKNADIIHFHMLSDENSHVGPLLVKNYIKGKKIIHHHHGHPHFRANPDFYRKKYKQLRRKVVVSTPDLLKLIPEATWVPNIVPINDPLLMPRRQTDNGKILIGQSPTRKDLKNTTEFIKVVSALQADKQLHMEIELQIIELMEHKICLTEKNKCHIIFDHMQGYYGVSSLECLSQAKPVIAGLDAWNTKCIREFTGTDHLPWLVARNAQELQSVLIDLINDRHARHQAGRKSRQFMKKFWNEQQVLQILLDVYQDA